MQFARNHARCRIDVFSPFPKLAGVFAGRASLAPRGIPGAIRHQTRPAPITLTGDRKWAARQTTSGLFTTPFHFNYQMKSCPNVGNVCKLSTPELLVQFKNPWCDWKLVCRVLNVPSSIRPYVCRSRMISRMRCFARTRQGTSVFLRKNCRFSTIAEFHEKHLSFTANRRRLAARLSIVEVKNGLIRLQRELASAF